MSDIDVREIDPSDQTLLRAWWEVQHAAEAERPYDFSPSWEEAKVLWTLPAIDREVRMLAAFSADTMVGACRLVLPESDNNHMGWVDLWVHPDHRRRGAGRALVTAFEAIGDARGRKVYLGEVCLGLDGEGEGSAFAIALGYPRVSLDELKVADLVETEGEMAALRDEVDAALGDYELLVWTDRTPSEHVAGLCHLFSRFLSEIPLEDTAIQPQTWDETRLRRVEERRAKAGYHELMVVARAPDGALVGYSNAIVGELSAGRAGIDGTLVLPEHRGHRLGLALKIRLHQMVREQYPQCQVIVTGNAGVNEHMNAVNARLGYRVVEHLVGVQKSLAPTTP